MSKRATFFATRSDLAALLAAVDAKINLQFVKAGRAEQVCSPATFSIEGVPDLGFASANSSSLCTGYLIIEIGVTIVARELASAPRFAFDQLANPKSAVFTPGGLWKKDVIIGGSITTASNDPSSVKIVSVFKASLKTQFSNIRGNFVGDEALQLLKQGKRLTAAESSPIDYDLRFE